jgi:hypothetical protein
VAAAISARRPRPSSVAISGAPLGVTTPEARVQPNQSVAATGDGSIPRTASPYP